MGDVRSESAITATKEFPQGWRKLPEGDPILGDASATADKVLVTQTAPAGHGAAASAPKVNVQPMFKDAAEYIVVGGYDAGGDDYFLPGGRLVSNDGPFQGWLHTPHYAVVQVKPVLPVADIGGAPPEPAADPSAAPINVVMLRDLGRLRQPSALFALAFSIAFAVSCYTLHRRDKEVMAARAAAGAGGPAPAVG
jgi:hypothetical protein